MLSNKPFYLGKLTAFRENPFTVNIELPDDYEIVTPVAVEYWAFDQNLELDIPIEVTGQNLDFTISVEQLRIVDAADVYITFGSGTDKLYKFHAPATVSMDSSLPTSTTFQVNFEEIGPVKVSIWSDAAAALEAKAARDEVEVMRDEVLAATIDISDRVPGFLDDLQAVIMAGQDNSYTTVAGPVTSSSGASGCTIDTTNKIFNITSGNSGQGSYIRQDFDLTSTSNLRVGDKINIRSVVSQTVDGAISSTVLGARLFTGAGVSVSFTNVGPTLYDAASKTFTIDGQFTVANISTTYYIELYIKTGAPNQGSAVALRWLDVGLNQDKYLYQDAVNLINDAVQAYRTISVTFDDQPVVTQIDLTGVSDVTAALQAEFDLAIATSGKWRGRVGTPRISASISVNGRIDADFGGMDVNVAIPVIQAPSPGSEMFFINTASAIFIRNITTRRLNTNPSHSPTFCRFNPVYINVGSQFERVFTWNMPRSMVVDYCDGLEVLRCDFGGGEFQGLRAGILAPASMTNLKVRHCNFQSYLNTQCQIGNLTGLLFEQNTLKTTSAVTFPNRALELITQTGSGTNSGARILNNKFGSYREYGLLLSTVSGTSINDIQIMGNFFDDRTPDATDASSRGMHIAGISKNISMIDIAYNHLYCKEIGIWMDNITRAHIQNNTFEKSNVGGAYATSQAMVGSNMDFYSSGNIISSALGVATNKATWGTEYTTV